MDLILLNRLKGSYRYISFFTAEGRTGQELLARAHSAQASWILLAVFIKLTLIHVFDLLSTKACGSL